MERHGAFLSAIRQNLPRGVFPRLGTLASLGVLVCNAAAQETGVERLRQLSIEELMEMEVTSVSRAPIPLRKAPSALQVITQWEIRRAGATSLPEALRLASNLHVARKNTHDWGISARGFNTELGNKLLVLMDGRAVYTPLWSGVRWDVQDTLLEDIDRIEVISGPGASIWGANAVNGVINILTRPASATQGVYAEAGLGDQLERFGAVRFGATAAPGVAFRVYAKHVERDDEFTASGPAGDATELSQIGFRVDAERNGAGLLTLQGDYYRGDEGVISGGVGRVEGGNLLGRWTKVLSPGSEVSVQAYYDRATFRLPTAASLGAGPGVFTDDLSTYDVDLQHRLTRWENHALTWGLGYRSIQDRTTASPSLGFDPARTRHALYTAFVQDQIRLGPTRTLTLGSKLEHTHYTGWEVEPTVRLHQDLGGANSVWAAVSRAVRTPSRLDRDVRQPSDGFPVLRGGADYRSETVVAYEAGLRGGINHRLTGSLSVFYNHYSDLRSIAPSAQGGLPLVIGNDLQGDSHGLEFSFDLDLVAGWRFHGGYTVLETDLEVRRGGSDINNALNETADPRHQFSLGTSVNPSARTEVDLHYRWVDDLEINNGGRAERLPGYGELNARVAFRLSRSLTLSLVGQNLLDAQHLEMAVQNQPRVEIKRSVFVKLAWRH